MKHHLVNGTAFIIGLGSVLASGCTIKVAESEQSTNANETESTSAAGNTDTGAEESSSTAGPSSAMTRTDDPASPDGGTGASTSEGESTVPDDTSFDPSLLDGGGTGDAEPPPPVVDAVNAIGVGVSGDLFCADGSFTITVQPKNAAGELVQPEVESLTCNAELGGNSVDCEVTSIQCDPGGNSVTARTVVLVVVDDSGSMDDNDPDGLRLEACTSFVDQLGSDDIVAITDFGNGGTSPATALRTVQGLTSDKDAARAACQSLVSGPVGTPIYGAVTDAASVFLPAAIEEFGTNLAFSVLLLSDGQPDSDTATRSEALTSIEQSKFPIYTVGLGPAAEGSEASDSAAVETLQELSQVSGGAYASSSAPEGLNDLFEQVGSVVKEGSCEVSASLHADAFASGELVSGQLHFAQGDVSSEFGFTVPSTSLEASRCQ